MTDSLRSRVLYAIQSGIVGDADVLAEVLSEPRERVAGAMRKLAQAGNLKRAKGGRYAFVRGYVQPGEFKPRGKPIRVDRTIDLTRYQPIALDEVWPGVVAVGRAG